MTTANVNIRRLTWSAIWLALALVLPFLTGQIPTVGSMLCPHTTSSGAPGSRVSITRLA